MTSVTAAASALPRYPRFVICTATAARPLAIDLARELGLPFLETSPNSLDLHIVRSANSVELHDTAERTRLCVDFTSAELKRYRSGGSGRHPLRRAIGPGNRHVVDANAGLGRDAVHLAALGYRVTAIERNLIVSALAQDGLRRARAAKLLDLDNPRWHTADACAVLPTLDPPPDTIYLDPMFPQKRKKSAAVRKEMRLLSLLVAENENAAELFAVARAHATDRVVVKRPIDAAPLAPHPSASYAGKLVRYDVYRATAAHA